MHDPTNKYLEIILANWFTPAELSQVQIREVAGGLSGAKIWQVAFLDKDFCLRRWPQVHPTIEQLAAIHGLIEHVWNAGFVIVPLPRHTFTHQTLLNAQGHLWELAHWLPGETSANLTAEQVTEAMQALAGFHLAAAHQGTPQTASAPGLQKRLDILQQMREGLLDQLERAVCGASSSVLREISLELLADIRQALPATLSDLEKVVPVQLPLQWCLRDVHVGNLLFTDNRVTGIVDFGAAAIDSVAGDIARLVGSLASDDANLWRECLRIYQVIRPLSPEELQAVALFDSGGLIAAATNWLRWLFVEQHEFADAATTQSRLSHLARRLKSLNQRGGSHFLGLSWLKS
ncbi:MAG: phosphotransferase [Bythopirellula sp.]|nr:phosphotransferase [Bythopirellula sp.]